MNASAISRLCIKEGLCKIWKKINSSLIMKSFACVSENETSGLTDDFLKGCS